jgi:acetyl esterase
MPLHPALRRLIDQKLAHTAAPQWELPVAEVRTAFSRLWSVEMTGPPLAVGRIEDRAVELDGWRIPVRLHIPQGARSWPVAVYLHGGGYVKGGIQDSDAFCRRLAHTTRHAVAAVDYRLAPEHRFPAALDDTRAAIRWALENAAEIGAQPGRVVVIGESAGGNLAAVTALLARDRRDLNVACQVLLQPVLDFTLSFPSIDMPASECLVPRDDLAWYYRTYYGVGSLRDPLVSPIWAEDLSGLPPALIIAAEYDSLRDEAEAYAGKLQAAESDARYSCYAGMVHGFLQMGGLLDQAQQAIDEIAAFLRR